MWKHLHSAIFLLTLLAAPHHSSLAQQIGINTPFTGFSDSYFERMGVNFGFSLPGGQGPGSRIVGILPNGQFTPNGNIYFSQGGMGSAIPQFGGYDPAANARFGFGVVNPGGGGFSLGFDFGKGSSRTMTNSTPGIVVQNGFGGSISSGQLSPFVTGLIPFVGGNPAGLEPMDNGVTRALSSGQLDLSQLGRTTTSQDLSGQSIAEDSNAVESTAERAQASVAEIQQRKSRERQASSERVAQHLRDVDDLLAKGRVDLARVALNKAIVLETDASKKQGMKQRLKSMR